MSYTGTLDNRGPYQRETNEWCGVHVVDSSTGTEHTTGLTVCIVADGTRPSTFIAPTVNGGKNGITITGLSPNTYHVYAKVSDVSPFLPEVDCGTFVVS